eukprot:CAMPEP_0177654352 /NCGR_PEP_ID=MMETSP0447-20121125/14280_1 /TAXON_ID=0 /ORGANISM="Stygamoeba regulata, Strain BSH-02190019" /LENGTH=430 /DNA_ID=CAMNT_0019157983 /DNA_START=96 /DNA_END=1384 /DNA_ORIENTATION=-
MFSASSLALARCSSVALSASRQISLRTLASIGASTTSSRSLCWASSSTSVLVSGAVATSTYSSLPIELRTGQNCTGASHIACSRHFSQLAIQPVSEHTHKEGNHERNTGSLLTVGLGGAFLVFCALSSASSSFDEKWSQVFTRVAHAAETEDAALDDVDVEGGRLLLKEADKLYDEGRIDALYDCLVRAYNINKLDPEVLWRLARVLYEREKRSTDQKEKKELIKQAHVFAAHSLKMKPDSFAAHKWLAIILSREGEFDGIKAQLQNSILIRDHFQKAVELNPKDATSHHLLGLWCFTFADMPRYQRWVASTLFATPPSSTYEEAEMHFLKAEEMDPGFYKKNALLLAKTYLRLNQKDEAIVWLDLALAIPTKNLDDEEAHAEAAPTARKTPKAIEFYVQAVIQRNQTTFGETLYRINEETINNNLRGST